MALLEKSQCPYCNSFLVQALPRRARDHYETWLKCSSCLRIWAPQEQAASQLKQQHSNRSR